MIFDPGSFFIGVIVAFFISFLLYRRREALAAIWLRVRTRLTELKEQFTAGIEVRYQKALDEHCEQWILSHGQASFAAAYVPQKFEPPPPRPTLNPIDPDTRKPLSLSAALRSAPRLVVLGEAGSGRTTLLLQIARLYLSKQGTAELGTAARTPVLLHLAEVDWSRVTDGDPLPQMLEAATAHVSPIIAPNAAGLLKNRIRADAALLLLDGFDELKPELRPRALQWLSGLLHKYPTAPVVLTTGLYGYGPLQNLGFAPLRLASWDFAEVDRFTENWLSVIGGGKQDRKLLVPALRQLFEAAPRPIDFTLAVIFWRSRTRLPANRVEAYDYWVERSIPNEAWKTIITPDKLTLALSGIAWATLQEQRLDIGLMEIELAIRPLLPAAAEGQTPTKSLASAADIARALADRSGLFVPFGLDAYAFAHSQLTAYLAAYHAAHTTASLEDYWDQAVWQEVYEFYAAMADPNLLVMRALQSPDDLSRTRLVTAARWTGFAAPEAAWRSKVLSELARTFLQPELLPALRAHALDGLIATHDKGLPYLLKRGMTHPDPVARRLSVRGLSSLGREGDLPIFNGALKDPQPEIHHEALQAIANLARNGSGPATEVLIKILVEQDDESRRLAAETLAQCGEEGYQILREAAAEEDIKVRRAAAYGLAVTDQAWALELLQKMEREEKQWFVRNAVLDALNIMQTRAAGAAQDPTVDLSPVVIDKQGWLVEWAAKQGVGIGVGRQATQALLKALTEGETPVRLAAIQTLRLMGDLSYHDQLRGLLYDPERDVRETAFEALETIGQRAGVFLPR